MAFEDDPRIKGRRYDRAAADLLRHPIRDFVKVMPLAERAPTSKFNKGRWA